MLVRDEGLLFGPKQVDAYLQEAASIVSGTPTVTSRIEPYYVSPPLGFGPATVQKLLNARVLYTQRQQTKTVIHRGWSLKDFWELVSWPRDTSGGANQRFGFPIPDDVESLLSDEAVEEPMKNVKPYENPSEMEEAPEMSSSYVVPISSLDELDRAIVATKKTCLMFLSASYCRTCKSLTPQYNRLARQHVEQRNMDVAFVKVDVSSASGKILSRALAVDAVPTFVMFQRGKLYGEHLSVSRLPSKKLELAIQYLSEGKLWNKKAFESIENER